MTYLGLLVGVCSMSKQYYWLKRKEVHESMVMCKYHGVYEMMFIDGTITQSSLWTSVVPGN
jgi:hypothetical protein